jgi:hypothetical protein
MKRAILFTLCILAASSLFAAPSKSQAPKITQPQGRQESKTPADPRASLDAVLDFSISLKEIAASVKSGSDSGLPEGKFFILNGTFGSVLVRSREGEAFNAEAELVDGQWQGLETVEMYRAIVVFSGNRFAPLFAKDSPDKLKAGDVVMVLGRYKGTADDYSMREKVAVINAEMVRLVE